MSREREELHARMRQQAEELRAEFGQLRGDADRTAAVFRNASDAKITALEEARGQMLDVSCRLAVALETVVQLQESGRRTGKPRGSEPTKRARMIELTAQRQDLAAIAIQDVSKLATTVASEIGYGQGTARRELMRHVRQIQDTTAHAVPDGEGGQAQ